MKKLYIVVNHDWFFLSHRKEIALAARKTRYDVTIIAKDTGEREKIEKLGLKFLNLPMNSTGLNIKEELKTFSFLYRLYKREKPDIVHHVGLKTILWGTLAAKFARINGIVNAVSGMGTLFTQQNKSVVAIILPKIFRFSHRLHNLKVIFQNSEDKDFFVKERIVKPNQTVLTKGSGVDLTTFCYTPEPEYGKIKVLLTARMIVEKGVWVIVEAALKLKEEYQDKVEFLLCGGLCDHPKAIRQEELETICDGDYIQWLGYRTDVLNLLNSCHIYVLPSYYKEGLPKSLIEAAAVGRPIITTNRCKDTVIDGYNGYLIPVKDSDSLAEKLRLLIDNPVMRQEMGRNSRKLAERDFSIENVIAEHLKIYQGLINS